MVVALLVLGGLGAGAFFLTRRSHTDEPAAKPVAAAPSELGPETSRWDQQVSAGTPATVALPDGAQLTVPAGNAALEVTVARRDLSLEKVDPDVQSSWLYEIRAAQDATFDKPLLLHVPGERLRVWEKTASGWTALPPGGTIEVTHLSIRDWLVRTETAQAALEGAIPDQVPRTRFLETKGAGFPSILAFYGVGEKLEGKTQAELCAEFATMIAAYPGKHWAFAGETAGRNDELYDHLHANSRNDDNYFWYSVAGNLGHVSTEVLTRPKGSVTPAELLKICIDAAGGNVPNGLLTCMNWTKEVTNQGRSVKFDQLVYKDPATLAAADKWGGLASRLTPWRTTPKSPGQYYDKMGPIYHLFSAMTASVWFSVSLGKAASFGEAWYRIRHAVGDYADPEKGQADLCGADVGNDLGAKTYWDPLGTAKTNDVIDSAVPVADGALHAADAAAEPPDAAPEADAAAVPVGNGVLWSGRWSGKIKSSFTMKGKTTPLETTNLEIELHRSGDSVSLSSTGGAAMTVLMFLKPDGTAFGKGRIDAKVSYSATVFFKEGRLYLAEKIQYPKGTVDLIGIFDRVPR